MFCQKLLWERLPDCDKQLVVYLARHQERKPKQIMEVTCTHDVEVMVSYPALQSLVPCTHWLLADRTQMLDIQGVHAIVRRLDHH